MILSVLKMLAMNELTRGLSLLPIPAAIFVLISSCSLNYGNDSENDTMYPEFSFSGVSLVRYENARQTVQMSADQIEKYRGENATYAQNAAFTTWNDSGEIENEGKCSLLKADSDSKKYVLLDGIKLKSASQNFEIEATSLFWDGKSEQMTSGADELVVLSREDLQMEGRGFQASGIDKSFSFRGKVDGVITTNAEDGYEE